MQINFEFKWYDSNSHQIHTQKTAFVERRAKKKNAQHTNTPYANAENVLFHREQSKDCMFTFQCDTLKASQSKTKQRERGKEMSALAQTKKEKKQTKLANAHTTQHNTTEKPKQRDVFRLKLNSSNSSSSGSGECGSK